ncbi:MAG: endonuclease/exonuclease/phosphatase family protein [Rikenellaceae bacterium]|jgi:endonuclease/exonuclease/phosphatase family metal-dependent hydrolase|nr:endonuclease/exonuclease/phosphatase family protein [Rikenellaceae bacterium]
MRKKNRANFIGRLFDGVMLVLSGMAAIAMLCAYLAPLVDPNRLWIFAYAGLGAPILYLINLFLMLYWAIRWKAAFFLPLFVLLIGAPKIKTYYHFSSAAANEIKPLRDNRTVKVLTYNVEGFMDYDPESQKSTSTAREITAFIREQAPDIICLQEFQATPRMPEDTLNRLLAAWPHRRFHYTVHNNRGNGVWGTAIYSKFRIAEEGTVDFEESRNGALWVTVLTPAGDSLRVFCNHLETTYVDRDNVEFFESEIFASDPDKTEQLRQIAGRLRRGFFKRAHQADTLARLIASREVPTVVCGDFNDPPMSYTYRTMRGDFGDAFESKGHGYGFTYKNLYRLMRIDYILPSPHWETLSYESPDVPWSDHNPVIATLRWNY